MLVVLTYPIDSLALINLGYLRELVKLNVQSNLLRALPRGIGYVLL